MQIKINKNTELDEKQAAAAAAEAVSETRGSPGSQTPNTELQIFSFTIWASLTIQEVVVEWLVQTDWEYPLKFKFWIAL